MFRQLNDTEFEAAYGILVDTVAWMLARGIRQWTRPYPREQYEESQRRGENYGLFDRDELVAILTLHHAVSDEWKTELGTESRLWLSRLAVRPDRHGEGLGRRALVAAINQFSRQPESELWLDCVQGRLPAFYSGIGFEVVAAKTVKYSRGSFDMLLMKCGLEI